jgi:hypothetical protein
MLPLLALLLSCDSGSFRIPDAPLVLEVTSPDPLAEGAVFTGSDAVRVTGRVNLPNAVVTVENREVVVGSDGTFDVEVPISGAYRNIDVRAFYRDEQLRERIPVFSGTDPLDAWPGGIGVRITPRLFEPIADSLATQIDETGWAEQLLGLLGGGIDTDTFRLVPTELRHRPAEVELVPDADGVQLVLRIRDITLELDAGFELNGTFIDAPSEVGFEELLIVARANVVADANGFLTLDIGTADVELSDPVLQLGPFDGGLVDFVVQLIGDLITGIGDFALDLLLGIVGDVPLGGPFAFELDLLGEPLEVSLESLDTDPDGVTIDLGLGLGTPVPDPLVVHRPTLEEGGPQADIALTIHEGLFASLVDSELLDLLAQDLELGGVLGLGVGLVFENLPGGDTAPEADAWCIAVDPGDARSARMNGSLSDFATMYLPDLQIEVGITHDGIDCDPWLDATLAVEAGFVADGSALELDLSIPDGAVTFYAAEGAYDEQEVVQGLGGLFDVILPLLGGALSFDLADLLGGGELIPGVETSEPRLTGVYAIEDAEGVPVPGLYAVGLDLL